MRPRTFDQRSGRRARRLFVARWTAVFLTGLGVMNWTFFLASPPLWVNMTMSGLWGHGVAKMMQWDQDRLVRKALAQLDETIAALEKRKP